jgi:acetyl esterase
MLTEQERTFLEALAKAPVPTDVQGLRTAMDTMTPMLNSDPPEIGAFNEAVQLRPGLTADVAVPKGNGPHPVVVYLHGGGWIGGSTKTHRKLGMQFAEAGYLTINVEYRLAPEHPFPAGLEDCVYAVKWAGDNAKRWNGDVSRLAVGGDSAGGNLTAATLTSLAAEKYAGPAKPKAALLIYGLFDFPATIKREKADLIDGMVKAYAGAGYPAILEDPRVSPLRAVKPGALPPSFVICGTADPLLPETHAMADALKRADIRHEVVILEDMPHGFLQFNVLSGCKQGLDQIFDFLRRTI